MSVSLTGICSNITQFGPEDGITETRLLASKLMLAFTLMYIGTTLPIFMYLHWTGVPQIACRKPWFVYITVLGQGFPICFLVGDVIGRHRLSCFWPTFLPSFIVTINTLPHLVRVLLYYFEIKASKHKAEFAYATSLDTTRLLDPATITQEHAQELPLNLSIFQRTEVPRILQSSIKAKTLTRQSSIPNALTFIMPKHKLIEAIKSLKTTGSTASHEETYFPTSSTELDRLRFFSSTKFGLLLLLPFVILSLTSFFLNARDGRNSCAGCQVDARDNMINTLLSFLSIIICVVLLRLVEDEPDHFKLQQEVWLALFLGMAFVTPYVFLDASDPGDVNEEGSFNWIYMASIGWLIFYHFSIVHQIIRAWRFNTKKQELKEGENEMQLTELLLSETGTKLFKAYLVEEATYENFMFYRDATIWKYAIANKQGSQRARENVLRSARKLHDIYIRQWAISQINISSTERTAITHALDQYRILLDREQGLYRYQEAVMHIDPRLFNDALEVTWDFMATDSFTRFKTSKHWKTYMRYSDNCQG